MFGGHATSCVRHAVAELTLRWEEVCFSFGHYWLYEYWLTTLGSSHVGSQLIGCWRWIAGFMSRLLFRFGVALLGCQYPWHSNVELASILCGHQAVAGLTPRWEEVCFGLQQCQTDAYLSTMLIVYGIRRRAHPSVFGQSSHCMVCPGFVSWFHRPSHSYSVMRSSVATSS